MSAEGFEIQVGRRYQSGKGYYVIPSHVGEEEVLFDGFSPNGTQWGSNRTSAKVFRYCYAPVSPDLLKEAVELLKRGYSWMKMIDELYQTDALPRGLAGDIEQFLADFPAPRPKESK